MRNGKAVVITLVLAMALVGAILVQAVIGAPQDKLELRVKKLEKTVAELKKRLEFVSIENGTLNGLAGPHMIIEGANVHVRDGGGFTSALNGLGNLIIGYNEDDFGPTKVRTGSHNLVVGPEHTYSSFGGFVAGTTNTISGIHATVSGGQSNIAMGISSSVSGGSTSEASGLRSSVSGGTQNLASGDDSSVSGGQMNTASGGVSSVSGGNGSEASGIRSSVSGGASNNAIGTSSSVSGGTFNNAMGFRSSVSGGSSNDANGNTSAVSGGSNNNANGSNSTVGGGVANNANGLRSSVSGGRNCTVAVAVENGFGVGDKTISAGCAIIN